MEIAVCEQLLSYRELWGNTGFMGIEFVPFAHRKSGSRATYNLSSSSSILQSLEVGSLRCGCRAWYIAQEILAASDLV